MPDLKQYEALAPFSARELVDAANSLLRSKPELELSERTLRYYVSENLLPSPEGPTKFARYSFDHLVGLTAIRFLQDHGISLERIRDELRSLFEPDNGEARRLIENRLSKWLSSQARLSSGDLAAELREPSLAYQEEPRSYARGRASNPAQELAQTVLSAVKRELSSDRHFAAGNRVQASVPPDSDELLSVVSELRNAVHELRHARETETYQLQAVMGELTDGVRALQQEIRALREQAEMAREEPATPETEG